MTLSLITCHYSVLRSFNHPMTNSIRVTDTLPATRSTAKFQTHPHLRKVEHEVEQSSSGPELAARCKETQNLYFHFIWSSSLVRCECVLEFTPRIFDLHKTNEKCADYCDMVMITMWKAFSSTPARQIIWLESQKSITEKKKKNHKVSFQVDSRSTGEKWGEKISRKIIQVCIWTKFFLSLLVRRLVYGCLRHIFSIGLGTEQSKKKLTKLNAPNVEERTKFFAALCRNAARLSR